MNLRIVFVAILLALCSLPSFAQQPDSLRVPNEMLDSLFIEEVEGGKRIDKVLHAEPLYIDLIRDLGARKGEKEWNVGMGLADKRNASEYIGLVEYEWAPIDRLGLEVELPFTFSYPDPVVNGRKERPDNRLNSLKLAAQYSIYVSEKNKTSMALGYLHEFGIVSFHQYGKKQLFESNLFNPFFIVAKRWGNNFHTLVYTGPAIEQFFETRKQHTLWQLNSNFHYMISGTRNFIGLEVNQEFEHNQVKTIMRPQMRLAIVDNLMVGVVTGIPTSRKEERGSFFIRVIYEPRHH